MYTRSTPQRAQQPAGGNANNQQFQQQQYNQGNYQGGNQNQQNAYKQQGQGNTPFKQQQQQQPQTPQQQQQRNVQQTKQQQPQQPQQQSTPQPQRLKPILKSSSQSNVQQAQADAPADVQLKSEQVPQSNNGMDTNEVPDNVDSEGADVPKWRRRVPGYKVSRKAKRLRINQRLRKVLQPKNAIMVLHEMKTGVQFVFPESQSVLPSSLFLAHAEINGKTYTGQGISKPLARQNAAENALKSLLLEKMTAAAQKAHTDAESDSAAEGENKDNSDSMETGETPDEIPWSSLASFALYKLFLEWQNQGTVVPVPRPGLSPKVKKEGEKKPVEKKELPPNAESIHPVMLLNQMRPGLIYNEVSRVGNPPNITFTLAIEVDGVEYSGTAKNKKDAKKFAAKAALNGLYNLVYPEEKESEDVTMTN